MGRTGIYNTQFSHRNLIFNNFLYQNYRYGISYTSSSRGRVIGNYIKENYDFGMNWDATYGENYYTTIANNIFENNTDTDLYIIGSSGSHAMYGTIVGNTFYSGWQTSTGTSFAAIKLIGANYITIANNVFRIKATAPGSSVFVVGGDSSNIVFTGNVVFMDNVYAGWNSYGTSLLIEGNQISGNGGQAVYLGFAQNVTVIGNFFNGPILAIGPGSDPCSGSDVIIKDNHFNCTGKIANNVLSHISNLVIKGNYGFTTENSGTATVANGEYVAHGLDSSLNIGPSNSTVTVTPYTVTYAGVPVVVGCSFVNGTHIQISAYWTNGTAITDDAIQVWWKVTYP
jgi:parallel beta-helix repeat protein